MISRYTDEIIAEIFSDNWKYNQWRHLECDYIVVRHRLGDPRVTQAVVTEVTGTLPPSPVEVRHVEDRVGHDVVAFLTAWTRNMSAGAASQVHYGLTSSDVVDNVLFRQLWVSGRRARELGMELGELLVQLSRTYRTTPRAGRTHGQLAEVTTLGHRFGVWSDTLINLLVEWNVVVEGQVNVLKTPGATGDMQILGEDVAPEVAEYRRAVLVPSTQVIPRQRLMAWAGWCLRLISLVEEIALEIRLSSRSDVGEMMEGAANGRVGSSAMPHKRNPIGSEQLSGLGRVARSAFAAIAETAGALHHERDISNSSVERTVVPDLAHITAYSLRSINQILRSLVVDTERMADTALMVPASARQMAELQEQGMPYSQAHRRIATAYGL